MAMKEGLGWGEKRLGGGGGERKGTQNTRPRIEVDEGTGGHDN